MGEVANQHHAAPSSSSVARNGVAAVSSDTGAVRAGPDQPFLAADVGGTHARIGLVVGSVGGKRPVTVLHYHRYSCADWSSLTAMLQDFVEQLAGTPHAAVRDQIGIARWPCAGYVLDDAIINDNLPWPVSIRDIRERAGHSPAGRRSTISRRWRTRPSSSTPAATRAIIESDPAAGQGPVLVMGPGTGLGSAVLLPGQPRAQVLATEAGRSRWRRATSARSRSSGCWRRDRSHVSFEHALSGPGLLNLYRALVRAAWQRRAPAHAGGNHRCRSAPAATRAAVEALDVFCGLLGSFVGDLVLLYGARGGVFLAGGILPQIREFLLEQQLRRALSSTRA